MTTNSENRIDLIVDSQDQESVVTSYGKIYDQVKRFVDSYNREFTSPPSRNSAEVMRVRPRAENDGACIITFETQNGHDFYPDTVKESEPATFTFSFEPSSCKFTVNLTERRTMGNGWDDQNRELKSEKVGTELSIQLDTQAASQSELQKKLGTIIEILNRLLKHFGSETQVSF